MAFKIDVSALPSPFSFLDKKPDDLEKEFKMLKNESFDSPPKPTDPEFKDFSTALTPENKARNRYKNILANNTTRVKLEKERDGSDYINANHCLNGRVIISQGPLDNDDDYEHHHADFYDMLWTNHCSAIAMVSSFVQNCSIKCSYYYPTIKEKDLIAGPYTISASSDIAPTEEDVSLKKLGIEITKLHIEKKGEESRLVTHYYYPNWGDFKGTTTEVVAALARRLLKENKPLIHCSAGIGRSGTLAAVMECYDRIIKKKYSDTLVPDVVNALRVERRGCVQTKEQYQTIYNTLQALVKENAESSSCHESGKSEKE